MWSRVLWLNRLDEVKDMLRARCRPQGEELVIRTLKQLAYDVVRRPAEETAQECENAIGVDQRRLLERGEFMV